MCIYCNPNKDTDILEKSIITKDIDCGVLGAITLNLWISLSRKTLELEAYTNENPNYNPTVKEIKFCPFCGREL